MIKENKESPFKKQMGRIEIVILLLICFTGLFLLTVDTASAITTLNSSLEIYEITDKSITWNYTYLTSNRPLGATLDGIIIEGWKTDYVFNYTAKGLEPNTEHEFCIFGDATSNCLSAITLQNAEFKIFDFIYQYFLLLVAVIFLILATKESYMGFIAFIFGCLGIIQSLNNSFIAGTLYMIVIVASIFISYGNSK